MTSHIDAEQWRRLSPHLDHALELEPRARADWLSKLETTESELADALRELLAEKEVLDGGRFLEDSPAAFAEGGTLVGQRIGVYEVEGLIERGGMGTVWLGRRCDGRYEGAAAVKLLNAALIGRPAEQRFVREGNVLAGLQHPNIAHLIDAGVTAAGQPYLILEHVEGSCIDEYCEGNRLDTRARLRVFLDVLEAVACAHRHLVVHRDLKPSNILVTPDGIVKLLDFGIATLLEPGTGVQAGTGFTREIGAALTPEYAAPEQLLGGTVTTATDVYALGRVLYVLLGGPQAAMPRNRSAAEVMRDTLEREPRLLSELAADTEAKRLLRGDLDNIVKKALKKEPRERYASVEAFADDLRRHLADKPVSARPDSFGYRAGKFLRRNRGSVLGGAVAALALVVTTGFALVQMLEAQRQRDAALEQTRRAEAFNQVVTSLLSQVGPDGRALGAAQLLDRAVEEVTARYAAEPALLVDLLTQISARYYELRDTRKEYATLLAAEAVARESGDAALVGNVLCNLTETELDAGRMSQAQARMAESRQLLRDARGLTPLVQVTCLRSAAELAAAQGDMRAVFAHLEGAQQLLEAEHLTDRYAYPAILTKLAKYHSRSGHLVAAYEYTRKVAELDRRAGRQDSMPGLIARMSVAVSLYHLGQVQPALAMFREVVPDRSATEPGNPPDMAARAKYGEMLARAGRIDAAMPLLLEAVDEAERSGHHMNSIRTRLSLAKALVFAGRAGEAQPVLEKAAALMRQDEAENSLWLAQASRLRIEMLLALRRVDEAAEEVSRAFEQLEQAAGSDEPRTAALLLTQARVRLARAEYERAAESARRAAALFQKNTIDPAQSADVGEALLVLARAELAAGKVGASRRSFERARIALRNSLGDSHELSLLAERLVARAH